MSLRCIHRHSPATHPNCFKRKLLNKDEWWDGKHIAYLDIETSNLKANFGHMLSWCIKYKDDPEIRYSLITKDELFNYTFDRRVTEELVAELNNVDILVTYYGKGFDVPFVRTKAVFWRIPFPEYGKIFHWDLYYHFRRNFKVHRNSLAVATDYFGIKGKTPLHADVWVSAQYGHPGALQEVLEHNRQDVIILEKLHKRIGDFSKWTKASL